MGFTNKDEHKHASDYETDMFTGITTYHGLVRIYNSKSFLGRCFWVTVVLTSFTVFAYQAFSLMSAYRAKPTLYQSNVRVPTNGIPFPAVTVCNFSPIKKQHVSDMYQNISSQPELLKYMLMHYMSLENFLSLELDEEEAAATVTMEQMLLNFTLTSNLTTNFVDQFFNDTSYNCTEMFKSCSFGGFLFDCCTYAGQIRTDVGFCWKFSQFGAESWMQRQYVSGQSYGLQILIDSETDEYPYGLLPTSEKGIRFYTHRNDEEPQMSSKALGVAPGRIAYASVSLTQWELLGREDWGVCQSTWDSADVPDRLSVYTLANCETNCMANYFMNLCNCVPLKYYVRDDMSICSPQHLVDCFSKKEVNASDVSGAYWYACSGTKCGIECSRREYETRVSYAEMEPSLSFRPVYQGNDNYTKQNYIRLSVFFKDISFEEHVQQRALDATVVLSNIGGNTGMFLGMSLITLAEISVFFFKSAWPLISGSRRKALEVQDKISPA